MTRPVSTRLVAAVGLVVLAVAALAGAGDQGWASPRLRAGPIPLPLPQAALAGGAVVVELTIDTRGAVTHVEHLQEAPPYSAYVAAAARAWQFVPATATIEGRATLVDAPVLVVALFRPPLVHAGPAPAVTARPASPALPGVDAVVLPPYPPRAVGDGTVVVEIALRLSDGTREYRVVGAASGFDEAAIDAVRAWRFAAPRAAGSRDRVFVYAVIGFRAPLVPAPPRQ